MASLASARSPLDRFLGALHRRFVLQRLLERTGLGVLGGCAGAVLLLPLLLWQDRPALPAVIGTLGLGGLLGALWGASRRPTLLQAAMEADRQLGLHDLLGTAAVLRAGASGIVDSSDSWKASVLASADLRCRTLRPGAVLLHRLGTRAWGGIGLSAAAVLAVALLAGSPSGSRAGPQPEPVAEANADQSPAPPEPAERPLLALVPGPLAAAPEQEDPDANSTAGRASDTKQPGSAAGADTTPDKHADEGSSKSGGTASAGTGSGSTQTQLPNRPSAPPTPGDGGATSEKGNRPDATATPVKTANGGGGPADDPSHAAPGASGAATGTRAGAHRPGRATPPWQTDAWPADVRRAHEALDAGQVPPAYQEMVRRYFDRP